MSDESREYVETWMQWLVALPVAKVPTELLRLRLHVEVILAEDGRADTD